MFIEKHLGPIFDNSYIQESKEKTATTSTPLEILPLSVCKTLSDLRDVALKVMPQRGKVYFLSGAETMNAFDGNLTDWNRVKFRPRVLRNVAKVSMRCSIMGAKSTLPVFIAPAAHARLGHDDGELCLVRGATRMGIPQCICTYASVGHTELVNTFQTDPGRRGGAIFFQLYVPKEKAAATDLIAKAKSLGFQALVVTVDSPVVGKRDDDDRFTSTLDYEAGIREDSSVPCLPGEEPGPLRAFHSPTLDWNDLTWIRECWGSKPIILKGIQTVEDAVEATRHDINGIYLSNHGGRQLDYAPSSVEVLLEIGKYHPDIFRKVDVYVDGGIMRGSDVVKALCLGARAVGIGRGFMFALSAYGTEGVLKAISSKHSPNLYELY